MRTSDKKKNMLNANLLVEQRYLNKEEDYDSFFEPVEPKFSEELYTKLEGEYSNARIIMSEHDTLQPKSVEQDTDPLGRRDKPKGLWYGFGTSWIDWVRSEMPGWEQKNIHMLDVDSSHILQINSYEELVKFDQTYRDEGNEYQHQRKKINWGLVAHQYKGIEINPYINKARMEIDWYYGWDVASGCIWDVSSIKNINKLS